MDTQQAEQIFCLQPGPLVLPSFGSQTESFHELSPREVLAAHTAMASGRPLLVLGEPGVGKTQLARAFAVGLKRHFFSYTLDAHTEVQDLFWTLDGIKRLAEAQVSSAMMASLSLPESDAPRTLDTKDLVLKMINDPKYEALAEVLTEKRFVRPGILWWAFDRAGAYEQQVNIFSGGKASLPTQGEWAAKDQTETVVLLDEIDKADPVLPNALLETLGDGQFRGPGGLAPIERRSVAPLVVITSNQERELPHAFMRRCAVLKLNLPKGEALISYLVERGQQHAKVWKVPTPQKETIVKAAQLLVDRRVAGQAGRQPGQAEFLDLLKAVCHIKHDEPSRVELLREVEPYILDKYFDAKIYD